MASSIFIWPAPSATFTGPILAADGTKAAPGIAFSAEPSSGWYRAGAGDVRLSVLNTDRVVAGAANTTDTRLLAADGGAYFIVSAGQVFVNSANLVLGSGGSPDVFMVRDAANTLALKNGTNAQAYRIYGYTSGSRSAYGAVQTVLASVTLSGATTSTGNVIPAGATVLEVSTTTTTTITGATGYQVGDGTTATRYGDITGTAVGTSSGNANYTADPRWWTNAARAVILTAKTSNFTGGVVQVSILYTSSAGA